MKAIDLPPLLDPSTPSVAEAHAAYAQSISLGDVDKFYSSEIPNQADPGAPRGETAVLVADWATYSTPVDRVGIARLHRVLQAFPQGFRIWWAATKDHAVPVGYSGWYPIGPSTFDRLRYAPNTISDRGQVAPQPDSPQYPVYIFNYSIVSNLRGSAYSRVLLQSLALDLRNHGRNGMAAITVSEDGARVARRFHLHVRGSCVVDGETEYVYTT